jgi:hypothetical protein
LQGGLQYSFVEVIAAKVPICLFKREGFKEGELMEGDIKRIGIGTALSSERLSNVSTTEELDNLRAYRMQYDVVDERFHNAGTAQVIELIAVFGDL